MGHIEESAAVAAALEPGMFFLQAACALAFIGMLVVISYVDLRKRIVKPECLLLLVLLWVLLLVLVLVRSGVRVALTCAIRGVAGCASTAALLCLLAAGYEALRKKESLGGGDIKLLAVFALFVGLEGALLCLFLACILSLAMLLAKRAFRMHAHPRANTFAFAPALCASAVIVFAACWF